MNRFRIALLTLAVSGVIVGRRRGNRERFSRRTLNRSLDRHRDDPTSAISRVSPSPARARVPGRDRRNSLSITRRDVASSSRRATTSAARSGPSGTR